MVKIEIIEFGGGIKCCIQRLSRQSWVAKNEVILKSDEFKRMTYEMEGYSAVVWGSGNIIKAYMTGI